MAKFRKKPVVVEAVQLRWDTWNEMCDHVGVGDLSNGKPQGCYIQADGKATATPGASNTIGLLIPTLEGLMTARENDFVIRGVKGEIYPCKPDIFEQTYEPV
jgi:hypothetical protein